MTGARIIWWLEPALEEIPDFDRLFLDRSAIEILSVAYGPVGEDEYPEGSYVIRMDQPYSRSADQLLDKQYYNPNDPRPYDDVGWTLGPLYNVKTARIEDTEVLSTSMTLVEDEIRAEGEMDGRRNASVYVIDYTGQNSLASFRFAHPALTIEAAERDFEVDDREFRAGAFILRSDVNTADLSSVLSTASAEYGFTAFGMSDSPDVPTHPVSTPRVAVVHTWTTTQSEGWLRLGFDQNGIPYDYISVHEIRDNPNLKGRWDVLVFGPSTASALSLLRGVTGDEAIAWQQTETTPNIGVQDSTSDMRGGLELEGVINLATFVRAGGTFVTISSTSTLPIHFGLAQGIRVKDTPNLWARGGVFRVDLAAEQSPLAYGYDDEVGVYFNTAPVFATGTTGRRRFGGFGGNQAASAGRSSPGSTTSRRTGRGGRDEEDIVQGRAVGGQGLKLYVSLLDEPEDGRKGGADIPHRQPGEVESGRHFGHRR